ncbi:MAG: hypothetical protein AAF063_21215 [Cyanobacteria bacterium J06643_5]
MKIIQQQSYILVLALSILFIFISSSLQRINVVVAGAFNVRLHCFKITNVNQYPDYLFIVLEKSEYSKFTPSNKVYKSSYCFDTLSFYPDKTYGEIYALNKSKINLEKDIINYSREHDFFDEKKVYKKLSNFESQRDKLIPAKDKIYSLSEVLIGRSGDIPPIYDYYEISNISDTALVLNKKEKNIIFYIVGTFLIAGALLGGIIYRQKVSNSNKIES